MKYELGEVQRQFAEIVWEKEPIGSGELVKICDQEFGWKKSTTYTVLKKLCEKGIFQNANGTVTSLISKDDFFALQSKNFVDETFEGSMPAFIAAFSKSRKDTTITKQLLRLVTSFGASRYFWLIVLGFTTASARRYTASCGSSDF